MNQTEINSYLPHSKERGTEKREEFKFRYLLTETQKNPQIEAPQAEIPAVRAVELCFQPAFASSFTEVFSLSHTHTEAYCDHSELPTKACFRFNESVIHYNKTQRNINMCRKNRLSAAQQMLVLIQQNKTPADHRKRVHAITWSKSKTLTCMW